MRGLWRNPISSYRDSGFYGIHKEGIRTDGSTQFSVRTYRTKGGKSMRLANQKELDKVRGFKPQMDGYVSTIGLALLHEGEVVIPLSEMNSSPESRTTYVIHIDPHPVRQNSVSFI